MNYPDFFTLTHSGSSYPLICSPSSSVNIPNGHRIISCTILPISVSVKKSDRIAYNLPGKIIAWRIASLENGASQIYTEVEFLESLRAPDSAGISSATFRALCSYGRDALGRIAPKVEKAVMDCYVNSKSLQNQINLF